MATEKKEKHHFIFTNRKNPPQGIMSTVLGVLSLFLTVFLIIVSYNMGGNATVREGAGLMVSWLLSLGGLICGAFGKAVKNVFYLFCYIGIGLNLLNFIVCSIILYIGMYA